MWTGVTGDSLFGSLFGVRRVATCVETVSDGLATWCIRCLDTYNKLNCNANDHNPSNYRNIITFYTVELWELFPS